MTEPASKLPTIQGLSREELLRLIPMICILKIRPDQILSAQAEVAFDQYKVAVEVMSPLAEALDQATERWRACQERKAPQKVTGKAWRAWLTANDAYTTAHQRAQRIWRRYERLSDQRRTLTERED